MSNRKTPGERISARIIDKVRGYGGTFDLSQRVYARNLIRKEVDRAIRRAQAEAWDEGICASPRPLIDKPVNPYRKGGKR